MGAMDPRTYVLALHIESPKGLLGAQKAQVLALFQHGEVAGLELGDEMLPEDTVKDRPWLAEGMTEHRQAFFHPRRWMSRRTSFVRAGAGSTIYSTPRAASWAPRPAPPARWWTP